jgi:hypothetical protein
MHVCGIDLLSLPTQHCQFLVGSSQFTLQMLNQLPHFCRIRVVFLPPATAHNYKKRWLYITDVLNPSKQKQGLNSLPPFLL